VGDRIALIGDNAKIVIFPVAELPVMPRGKGVKLQSYREGGLRDALMFDAAAGPAWIDASGRTRVWTEWREWLGRRGGSGRLAPKGFPANRRFRPG
jgi:topoisomerase-4 subunit A